MRAVGRGRLAPAAALLTPPASAPLVPGAQLRWIGQALERQDIPSKVDGSARYGLDVHLPGQVFAVVKHCPTFGGKLVATLAKPGATIALVPLSVTPGTARGADVAGNINAVAVVASTSWDAMRLARGLNVKWQLPANAAALDSAQILADAKALLKSAPPFVAGGANPPGTCYTVEASASNPDAALARNDVKRLDATYALPYVAHACMEVLNCTVDYVAGQLISGVVHAINATLYGQQTFVNGAAQRKNFNTNPMIRLQQMPTVSVTLIPRPAELDRAQAIGGVGELGVPSFAPALAGALLKLTGQAVRSLPLLPTATMGDG